MDEKVKLMKNKDKNLKIYQAVIDIKDDQEVFYFNIADNVIIIKSI